MPGFLPNLAGLSVSTGAKRVKESSSDESEADAPPPPPQASARPKPETDLQRLLVKASRPKKPDAPPSEPDEDTPKRGYNADSETDANSETDGNAEDDAGVDGDSAPTAPMQVDPPTLPAAEGEAAARLAELQRQKQQIEADLVTLEQMQEAEQASSTATMNAATNDEKIKTAKAQQRSMNKQGDEGLEQQRAQSAHQSAKQSLADARKRQKTDKASVSEATMQELQDKVATTEAERKEKETAYDNARQALADRINELTTKADTLARTSKERADALAELKTKQAEDTKALKQLDGEIKAATKEAERETKEAERETKAAAKEAEKESKAAAKEAEKATKAAAKEAEKEAKAARIREQKEAKERAEKCEQLACEIHYFRNKIVKDLMEEANELTDDLEKHDWCEGPDGTDALTIPRADARWFKELVRFVQDTENRLKGLIARNEAMNGTALDWRTRRHKYMLEDICPEPGEAAESSRMGKMVGTDSDEDESDENDKNFIAPSEEEDDSNFTESDAEQEWDKKRRMAAKKHVKSGDHKKEMYKKFPKATEDGDDPKALAKGKTAIQRELEQAEQKRKDEAKAPPGPPMERRAPAKIDIVTRDPPAPAPAPAAAGPSDRPKKRITPKRIVTDEDESD